MKNKETRQIEADDRRAERAKRTAEQQLQRLDDGGFVATKERARLTKKG